MADTRDTAETQPLTENAVGTPKNGNAGDNTLTDTDEKSTPGKSLWKDTTTKQKLILCYIVVGQFTTFFCASIPTPFLARIIVARGGEIVYSTVILQIMIFVMSFSSALFGKYQSRIGCKKVLFGGLICFGTCQIVFGMLEFVENISVFVGIGVLIKIIQGIGHGAYAVAALTIVCQEFTDQVGKVFGITESSVGIGFLVGPVLGSLLYSVRHDMIVPFVTSGAIILLTLPIGLILLKSFTQEGRNMQELRVGKFIFNFRSFLTLGCAASVYGVFGVLDVTSTVYLNTRGFSVEQVGLVIFASAMAYFLLSIGFGYVVSLGKIVRYTFFAIGLCGEAFVAYLFGATQPKRLIYVGGVLIGVFASCSLISAFNELVHLAIHGRPDLATNFNLHSALSGAWNFVLGFGTFIFPIVGSFIENVQPFDLSLLYTYLIGIVCALLSSSMVYVYTRYQNRRPEDGENTPLTSN